MNKYYTFEGVQSFGVARAADVNVRFEQIDTAFESLPPAALIAQQRMTYAVASGTANALVVALPVKANAYTAGLLVTVKVPATNTGPATINVDGLGVKQIVRPDDTPLEATDMLAGAVVDLRYDGFAFRLMGGINPAAVNASALAARASELDAEAAAQSAAADRAAAAQSAASIDPATLVRFNNLAVSSSFKQTGVEYLKTQKLDGFDQVNLNFSNAQFTGGVNQGPIIWGSAIISRSRVGFSTFIADDERSTLLTMATWDYNVSNPGGTLILENTLLAPTISGQILGSILGRGKWNVDTGDNPTPAHIMFMSAGPWATGNCPMDIVFSASPVGTQTAAEKLRVHGGGASVTGDFTATGGINAIKFNRGSSTSATGGNVGIGTETLIGPGNAGFQNVAVGDLSMRALTSGNGNTALGWSALASVTTGLRNIAVGHSSLSQATSGGDNIAAGYFALSSLTTGAQNTALGRLAGTDLTTGTRNTFVGLSAGRGILDGSGNTIIGGVSGLPASLANTIILADGFGAQRLVMDATSARFAQRIEAPGMSLSSLGNYANDAAAAVAGVPLNAVYRNGSALMIRVA